MPIVESILKLVQNRLELFQAFVVWFKEILNFFGLFFVKGKSLETTEKLLNSRIFKVSRVELNIQILDN